MVSRTEVQFYSTPITLTLRSHNKNQDWVGGQDENHFYFGKDMIVVGPSPYKGMWGTIKGVHVDGKADIELNNQVRRHATVNLTQLLLL